MGSLPAAPIEKKAAPAWCDFGRSAVRTGDPHEEALRGPAEGSSRAAEEDQIDLSSTRKRGERIKNDLASTLIVRGGLFTGKTTAFVDHLSLLPHWRLHASASGQNDRRRHVHGGRPAR